MSSVNKVILLGHVGNAPALEQTKNGTNVVKVSLATNTSYKDKSGQKVEETQWHNVSFFGNLADTVSKYIQKGSKIYVEGRIKYSSVDSTAPDGSVQKKYYTDIFASELTMLDTKGGASNNSGKLNEQSTSVPSQASATKNTPAKTNQKQHPTTKVNQTPTPTGDYNFNNADEDDLPF